MKRLFIACLVLTSAVFLFSACIKIDATKLLPDATAPAEQTPAPTPKTAQPTAEITPSPSPVTIEITTPEPVVTPIPTPAPAGVTEKKLGFIAKAYSKDGIETIDIDYVDMYSGAEAIAKALEDHSDWVEKDENGQYFIANDYYIRNNNKMLRSFPLAPACKINVVDWESSASDGGIPMKEVSFIAFTKLVKKSGGSYYLMHVDVQNGFLVSLEEQFRP